MYQAIGWYSKNEYMTGATLAEVMRKLQKAYPSPKRGARGSGLNLYGEPLRVINVTEKDGQYHE
jgi:hypothetical protein